MKRAILATLLPALLLAAPAQAQLGGAIRPSGPPITRNQPVSFTADQVEYDRPNNLVVASGHVEAWQNGHVLRADRIVFNRSTGTAAATGNVVLVEPGGEVLFADYVELTDNMRDAVLKDMRARLAENGKLAANGARRIGGVLNELSKVVYSPCNLCLKNPSKPPFWQVRAASATEDLQHKRIEYRDAELQMFGVPVAYTPYLSMPDPSVKRSSGLLMPGAGVSSHLGAFAYVPYYWAIDGESDATFTPMMTTRSGPQLEAEYRHRFNSGYFSFDGTAGYLENSPQGTLSTQGQFDYNDTWRWGFDINRASSADYIRNFRVGDYYHGQTNVLASQIYAEGFGQGSYARLDTRFYQGLAGTISTAQLPIVLPRYQYSYFGRPDALGGRLTLDADAFNVLRSQGTDTRRARLTVNWERPFTGRLGDLWTVTVHADAMGYEAQQFNEQPNFGPRSRINATRALPQIAVDWRWPFMRDSGKWGVQVIEPHLQLIAAPTVGDSQWSRYPNEDSLDINYTTSNLFSFNRFSGVDRLEGGTRLNAALQGTWYLGGTTFDGMIGQSYRAAKDTSFPAWSGLRDQVSDIVARLSFAPTGWLDVTYRTRLDHRTLQTRMADAVVALGVPAFNVTAGYIYTPYNPYTLYNQANPSPDMPPAGSAFYTPRNEIVLGANAKWGDYRLSGYVQRSLSTNQMVAAGANAAYENECFIFNILLFRRYTSIDNDHGSTALLFQFTFKTLGQIGYRAL
ncbi:MAG TPA: LPS assembly protein LptD [Acetobacteraceae bacterium]|nr:LPS assembly protein LptD [Acetobacteraceae bacterium]